MFNSSRTLIPYPKNIKTQNESVTVGKISKPDFSFEYCGSGEVFDEAVKLFGQKMSEKFAANAADGGRYKITLKTDPGCPELKDKKESYIIKSDGSSAKIISYDNAGAYYGVLTFTSLMYADGENICVPKTEIFDCPDFPYRGQFLECRYGSDYMTLSDWKNAIDYLASLKQNELTIGLYGCWGVQYDNHRSEYLYIPFEDYPQLKTPQNIKYYSVSERKWVVKNNVLPKMFEEDFFGELVAYGKKKNVNVKPLFNSLGHNSLIPRVFPELSAKNADGTDKGYGLCTNSPKTREFMFGLFDRIIDKYMKPYGVDSIHIGLDEVDPSLGVYPNDPYKKVTPFCECEKCRGKKETDLITDYAVALCKHLKSKGVKNIHIYHDMFFVRENILDENLKKRFEDEGIYENIIIHWWNYRADSSIFWNRFDEVNNIFRSIMKPMTGYYHWSLPPDDNLNIQKLAKKAAELGYEGIEAYGAFDECFDKNFKYCADVSWNKKTIDDPDDFDSRYALSVFGDDSPDALEALKLMRYVMANDVEYGSIKDKIDYYYHSYLTADKPYPRNYPGDAFSFILEDAENRLEFLDKIKESSDKALEFFTGCKKSRICNIWILLAKQYSVFADVFSSLTRLYKDYNSEKTGEKELFSEVERLLRRQENLMEFAENVRVKDNSYMYFRNLSITHRFLLDLKNYIKGKMQIGERPVFEITDLSYTKSEAYYFLR